MSETICRPIATCQRCLSNLLIAQFEWQEHANARKVVCMFCDPPQSLRRVHVSDAPKPTAETCAICSAKLPALRVKNEICVCLKCENRIAASDFRAVQRLWYERGRPGAREGLGRLTAWLRAGLQARP